MADIIRRDGANHCSSSLETNWQDSGSKNTINLDSYKIALTSLTAGYGARAGVGALSQRCKYKCFIELRSKLLKVNFVELYQMVKCT
jgi:hypothetical protein